MKLILLEKVANLGNLGEMVKVKAGYGRNYLVPKGKALPATDANVAMFEERRADLEAAANEKQAKAEARAEVLSGVVLKIEANASDEGKLFGSIGPREIADAVTETGVELGKSEVIMGEGPIRVSGVYDVLVQLHADVTTEIKVIVNEGSIVAAAAEEDAEAVEEALAEALEEAEEAQVVETELEDESLEPEVPSR